MLINILLSNLSLGFVLISYSYRNSDERLTRTSSLVQNYNTQNRASMESPLLFVL